MRTRFCLQTVTIFLNYQLPVQRFPPLGPTRIRFESFESFGCYLSWLSEENEGNHQSIPCPEPRRWSSKAMHSNRSWEPFIRYHRYNGFAQAWLQQLRELCGLILTWCCFIFFADFKLSLDSFRNFAVESNPLAIRAASPWWTSKAWLRSTTRPTPRGTSFISATITFPGTARGSMQPTRPRFDWVERKKVDTLNNAFPPSISPLLTKNQVFHYFGKKIWVLERDAWPDADVWWQLASALVAAQPLTTRAFDEALLARM